METITIDLADFADYARSKPDGATYNYLSNSNCALAHYLGDRRPELRTRHFPAPVGGDDVRTAVGYLKIPENLREGPLNQEGDEGRDVYALPWHRLAEMLEALVEEGF